jgi:sortase (surface protein transpeptidase)
VRRQSCGIWKCKACKITFAGGAFEFATSVATTAKVTMNRLMKLKDDVKAQEAKEKLEKQEKQQEKKEKKEKKDKKK